MFVVHRNNKLIHNNLRQHALTHGKNHQQNPFKNGYSKKCRNMDEMRKGSYRIFKSGIN